MRLCPALPLCVQELGLQIAARVKEMGMLSSCAPETLAHFAWACAKLRLHDPDIMSAIASRAVAPDVFDSLGPQSTTNIVCSSVPRWRSRRGRVPLRSCPGSKG